MTRQTVELASVSHDPAPTPTRWFVGSQLFSSSENPLPARTLRASRPAAKLTETPLTTLFAPPVIFPAPVDVVLLCLLLCVSPSLSLLWRPTSPLFATLLSVSLRQSKT